MHAQGWYVSLVALLSSNSPGVRAHALCLCAAAGLAAAAGSESAEAFCSALLESSAAPRIVLCLNDTHEAVLMHACAAIRSLSTVSGTWRDVFRKHKAVPGLQASQGNRNSLVARFCIAAVTALCHASDNVPVADLRTIGAEGEERLRQLEGQFGSTSVTDASPDERLRLLEEQLAAALAAGKLPGPAPAPAPEPEPPPPPPPEPPPNPKLTRLLAIKATRQAAAQEAREAAQAHAQRFAGKSQELEVRYGEMQGEVGMYAQRFS